MWKLINEYVTMRTDKSWNGKDDYMTLEMWNNRS